MIDDLLLKYSVTQKWIESIRSEMPELEQAEKELEKLKAEIQEFAKKNGEASGSGYKVSLSNRVSWNGKRLEGLALAHPEINACKSVSVVATIRKEKHV